MDIEKLMGKRVLMVIAKDNFRDEEYAYPRQILESEGARITVASENTRESRGMLGMKVSPQIPIKAVRSDKYDAVIVVGGAGAKDYLWDYADLHAVLRKANACGKVVAAICLACVVLAKAGILKDKRATVYKTEVSLFELETGGALYVPEPVVVDGTIITADGPRAAKDFGKAIVDALCK